MYKSHVGENVKTTAHDFLVSVELEDGASMSLEQIAERLAGSLSFVEGVGEVTVDYMGELEQGAEVMS